MRTLLLPVAALALTGATASAQRTIVSGEPVRGSLSSSDPQLSGNSYFDEFTFEGRRGETVTVELESDEFDAYLYLGRDRNGRFSELVRDDDGGDGTDSRLRYQIPEDGRYVIRASSLRRDTGPYTLVLEGGRRDGRGDDYGRGGDDYGRGRDDYGRGRDDGYGRGRDDDWRDRDRDGYLRANRAVRDYLSRGDSHLDNGEPYHLYRYAGRRGERVTITLRSDDFDSYLVLGTPGGRHGVQSALARDDDGGGRYDSRIEYTLPHDGEFVIRVNPMTRGYGRYQLELESSRGGWGNDGRPRPGGWEDRGFERLSGRWSLSGWRGGNAAFGTLRIDEEGQYTWRRNGQVHRGRLTRATPSGVSGSRARYFLIDAAPEQYYVSIGEDRGRERIEVTRRGSTGIFAYGYREDSSQRRSQDVEDDDEGIELDETP
jgi:hypothetical protein